MASMPVTVPLPRFLPDGDVEKYERLPAMPRFALNRHFKKTSCVVDVLRLRWWTTFGSTADMVLA